MGDAGVVTVERSGGVIGVAVGRKLGLRGEGCEARVRCEKLAFANMSGE